MKMDRETAIFYVLVIGLFLVSLYAGVNNRDEIYQLAKVFYGMGDYLKEGEGLSLYSKIMLFLIIWFRNTLVATLNVALGPLLGLFPIFTVFLNGYIIGGVTAIMVERISLEFAIRGILPHGVVELPTFLYSAVLGLKLARKAITHRFKGKELTDYYLYSLKQIPRLIAPLLMVAALIEAFITTAILGI